MEMDKSIEIKLLDISSIDEQLKIHQAAFAAEGISIKKDYWRKKHYENPLGNSLIFGAFIGEDIIGMNAYMPMEYNYKGEGHFLLQSCESGVVPEYQGKGVWGKIVRYALNYIATNTKYEAVIGFPNYTQSYPGFVKMGWITINDMENYVMVNNSKSLSELIGSNNHLKRAISRLILFQRILLFGGENLTVQTCEVKDLIWDESKDTVIRSHQDELMQWKEKYMGVRMISVKKGGQIVASCVFHFDTYNNGLIIKLESFESTINVFPKEALKAVLRYFRKTYPEIAFVRLWVTNDSPLKVILKKLLFIRSGHKNPFIISNQTTPLFGKPWKLSFYDLD